jgi:hypothetical protein
MRVRKPNTAAAAAAAGHKCHLHSAVVHATLQVPMCVRNITAQAAGGEQHDIRHAVTTSAMLSQENPQQHTQASPTLALQHQRVSVGC